MQAPDTGLVVDAKVVDVVDGDTVMVELTLSVRVRLIDVWAPETRTRDRRIKALGVASRNHLRSLIPIGHIVRLFIPSTDALKDSLSFNRVLGWIWKNPGDAKSANEAMVDDGFALNVKPASKDFREQLMKRS